MTAAINLQEEKLAIAPQDSDKERKGLETRIERGIESIDRRLETLGKKIKNESKDVSADVKLCLCPNSLRA